MLFLSLSAVQTVPLRRGRQTDDFLTKDDAGEADAIDFSALCCSTAKDSSSLTAKRLTLQDDYG